MLIVTSCLLLTLVATVPLSLSSLYLAYCTCAYLYYSMHEDLVCKADSCWMLAVHSFNLELRGRGRWISKFEASLVTRATSKAGRATQKIVLENQKKQLKYSGSSMPYIIE